MIYLHFPSFWRKKKTKNIRWPFFLLMELWCQPGLRDTLGHKDSWELSVFPQTLNLIWNSNNSHSINDLQPLINCRLLWSCRSSLHPWNGIQPCWARPKVLDHSHVALDSDVCLVHDFGYVLQSFRCPSTFNLHSWFLVYDMKRISGTFHEFKG